LYAPQSPPINHILNKVNPVHYFTVYFLRLTVTLTTHLQLFPVWKLFPQIQTVALHVPAVALPVVALMAVPLEVCLAGELQQSAVSPYFGVVGLKEHQIGLAVVVEVVVVESAALEPAAALVRDQP
jgi:hypothetical protein